MHVTSIKRRSDKLDIILDEIVELYFEGHELKEVLNSYKESDKSQQRENYVRCMADKMFKNWSD